MLVEPQDRRCRECGGQLEIVAAEDMETDAFDDGAMHYWPTFMAEQLGEGGEP